MTKGKILFIDTAHPELTSLLENSGFICNYYDEYNREDYKRIANKYIGIIVRSKVKLDKDFLKHCTNLRFIGRVGAGMENIDVEYARRMNIECLNAPEGNRDAVGEHALGMLLSLFNRLLIADTEVRKGIWIREDNRGNEIGGKTIGIIGYGNTGSSFAKKLSGFNCRVLAYDKYKTGFSNEMVTEATMELIYKEADILSLHVPLTHETTYLVNLEYLEKFHKNIYVINTSRGKVLRVKDLITCLDSGKVLGACLDVLEFEGMSFENVNLPPEFNKLVARDNVVLTPHIAGWTHESNFKMASILFEKIKALNL